jgi:phospholipase/carboxylesterase
MRTPPASKKVSVAEINARPVTPEEQGTAGLHRLEIREKRKALLYVPESAMVAGPAALAMMLHGAGGNAEHGLELLANYADDAALILLAPESRKTSWDVISDAQYGPDVRFIDEALHTVFSRYAIDPTRVAIGGFSDGASYALSLGLSNGLLFPCILAFSPGFMAPVRIEGNPMIFICHGTRDEVLPIDACSRRLVRLLRSHGLQVEYEEFDGPHTVPAEMRKKAIQLLRRADISGKR